MSFKFPSFNFQSFQESLPTVEDLKTNAAKTAGNLQKSFQHTGDMLSQQVQHLAQQTSGISGANSDVEVSELPEEYLKLEKNCDLLLKVYTDLIKFNHETFDKVSYDYPPANNAISKLKNANVSGFVNTKFSQLKNVSSPQELEKVLLGKASEEEEHAGEEQARIKTISAQLPLTLYGQLATLTQHHSDELKDSNSPLSFALLQFSSVYLEIASARLEMDNTIINSFSADLLRTLNNQFFAVNEMRKRVYAARLEFDSIRAEIGDEEEDENEELIAKEDELVNATEIAVVEMKKLLKPSVSVDLLKVFVTAQKEWFELSAKKLKELLVSLDKIEDGEDE